MRGVSLGVFDRFLSSLGALFACEGYVRFATEEKPPEDPFSRLYNAYADENVAEVDVQNPDFTGEKQ